MHPLVKAQPAYYTRTLEGTRVGHMPALPARLLSTRRHADSARCSAIAAAVADGLAPGEVELSTTTLSPLALSSPQGFASVRARPLSIAPTPTRACSHANSRALTPTSLPTPTPAAHQRGMPAAPTYASASSTLQRRQRMPKPPPQLLFLLCVHPSSRPALSVPALL